MHDADATGTRPAMRAAQFDDTTLDSYRALHNPPSPRALGWAARTGGPSARARVGWYLGRLARLPACNSSAQFWVRSSRPKVSRMRPCPRPAAAIAASALVTACGPGPARR